MQLITNFWKDCTMQAKLQIEVIETTKGLHFCFEVEVWEGIPRYSTSDRLIAPQESVFEEVIVERLGTQIACGKITWVGTHGASPYFCELSGRGQDTGQIFAKDFKVGDKITITPCPGKEADENFGCIYWANMLALPTSTKPYKS